MILSLLWRNLWRNKRRSLITMSSISFALLLSVVVHSLKSGVFEHLIQNLVSSYSGPVQIHQQGYYDEPVIDHAMDQDSVMQMLEHDSARLQLLPRLESYMLAGYEDRSRVCMLIGTKLQEEEQMSKLSAHVISGHTIQTPGEVLMGEVLASRLKVAPGDTLVLYGQGYQGVLAAGKYRLAGLLHFGSPAMNENFVYLSLADAQDLLGAYNRITSLISVPKEQTGPEVLQAQLKQQLPNTFEVMTWKEMMPEIDHHMQAENAGYQVFSGILYLLISFGFFGSVLMMTAERRAEFSMLMAIGMHRRTLGILLFMETLLLSCLGVIAGVMLALPLVTWFHVHPIVMGGEMGLAYERFGFEPVLPTAVNASLFWSQGLIVLVMSVIIGLYPVIHLRKIQPVIHAT